MKTFHVCYLFLCWALSNFVDPCWEIYHILKIKITYTPPKICTTPTLGVGAKTCLPSRTTQKCSSPTLGVDKNMFVRFHQNKCSKSLLIISLKSLLQKETWDYQKNREKRAKRKKRKEKKDENKDSPCSHQKIFHDPIRERYVSRSIIKFVYPSIHHITTHMHVLIWLYDIFLHGSTVCLSNKCNASMPYPYPT